MELPKPIFGDIPTAALPTPGQGLVLNATGQLPLAIRQKLPGYVYAVTQVTSTITVSSTTEASPTDIVIASPVSLDGGTSVWLEFFAPQVNAPTTAAGNSTNLSFYEGSTELGQFTSIICQVAGLAEIDGAYGRLQLTPTKGSHTYKVGGWCSGSTANASVVAGAGGTGARVPMFIRITRA